MACWGDLPVEVIVTILSHLPLHEILPLAIVDRKLRDIIGENFYNNQYGCKWKDVWRRITSPRPIIEKLYPRSSYSIYDPQKDVLWLFRGIRDKETSTSYYTVFGVSNPFIDNDSSSLPVKIDTILDPVYSFSFQYQVNTKFVEQIILPNHNIVVFDARGYIHHIEYEPFPSIICAGNSFSDGNSIKSYSWCTYCRDGINFIFICGGILPDSKLSNSWSIYNCTTKETVASGEMKKARYYHSCVVTADNNYVLITGGKNSTKVFGDGIIMKESELINLSDFSIIELEMNHCRNVHHSYLLPKGDIMILGGNSSSPVERFDPIYNEFSDLPYHITLNWKSLIAPVGDKFTIERDNSRFLEIIDVYIPPTLFSSHSLHRSLLSNHFKAFPSAQGRTLAVIQNSESNTCLSRIPFDDLKITTPRLNEFLNTEENIDGYLYSIDENFNIISVISFSSSFPEEFSKSVIHSSERENCKYLQLHLKSSIKRDHKSQIIKLITSQTDKILFNGLEI